MSNKKSTRGRKQGSLNRMTKQTKSQLIEMLLPHIKGMLRSMAALEPEKRVWALIKLAPYVFSKGKVSNEETEIQKILYEQLLPHFKKIGIYFNHVPEEQRAKVLVQCLKILTPKQISEIAPIINEKMKLGGISGKSASKNR